MCVLNAVYRYACLNVMFVCVCIYMLIFVFACLCLYVSSDCEQQKYFCM